MPRTEEQLNELRNTQREKILKATLSIVNQLGCTQTTIARIATEAGISKGLIYNYFDTKEHIYNEVLKDGFRKLHEMVNLRDAPIGNRAEFITLIDKLFDEYQNNLEFWYLYYNFIMQPEMRHSVNNMVSETMESMLQKLTDYFRKKGSPDPENEALFFVFSLDGFFLGYVINPEMIDLHRIKNIIINKYA